MARILLVVSAMVGLAVAAQAAEKREVTVFAAASLTDALQEIGTTYEAAHQGAKIKFAFAASSLLARQIEAGAHADIFFSADTEWMDYLARRKLIRRDRRWNLLSNRLVLIGAADTNVTLTIKPGFALVHTLGDSRLAIADPDTVPAGKYAKATLVSLGVWDAVAGRLARAENVRAALAYVARGESKLGIVYLTDANAERRVKTIDTFPADSHPSIIYPIALTTMSTSAEATEFWAYILRARGHNAFVRRGFLVSYPP